MTTSHTQGVVSQSSMATSPGQAHGIPTPLIPEALRRRMVRVYMACTLALVWSTHAWAAIYQDIVWHQLVPSGWNPTQSLRGLRSFTRLPDSDPRAQAMMDRLRSAWDEAPTVSSFDGHDVRIMGYVVPLESGPSGIREFLLVPYFGACIHTPPPPANQIIFVRLESPAKDIRTMSTVRVSGTLVVDRATWDLGVSGYHLKAASVEKYPPR